MNIKLTLLVSIVLFQTWGLAQTNDQSVLLKQYFEGQNKYFKFNGNVLVAKDNKVIYSGAHGLADYKNKVRLNENTIFELASVSKQFTAMAIMILKEKNKLSLGDDIKTYFPGLPYEGITIKELLTHTSGIPSYEDQFEKYWDRSKIAYNKDIQEMLIARKDTMLFPHGTKWMYSNTGYALLASIIEKVSGMKYGDYLAKYIFKPLGMKHTFVYNTRRSLKKIPANYALGHVYSDSLKSYVLPDDLKEYDMVFYLDGIVGDGCVNSTIGDLFIWSNAFTTAHLVSKDGITEMQSPMAQTNPKDSNTFYGYGLGIQKKSDKGKVISHSGGWPGYHTLLIRKPEVNETIILLSNNESNLPFFRAAIESILNNEKLELPYEHKEITIDSKLLHDYAGKYFAALTMEFVVKDNKLYRRRQGTTDIELKPESATKFFYADGTDRQIEFVRDADGKVTKGWFINMGQKGEMKRVE